jgi:hypothetical protein
MHGTENGSTPLLLNAFDPRFLDLLAERDEPPTAHEADVAGPWRIEETPQGYFLYRPGEGPQRHRRSTAVFASRFHALLTAAVLPGLGRDAAFRLNPQPDAEGYALESRPDWGAAVGHLELFDDKLVAALDVLHSLATDPLSLANFLEAVGGVALDRAGMVLAERVAARPTP